MATTDLTTITDDEARMRAFQIVGSDLGASAAFNGNWHDALKNASLLWSTPGYTFHSHAATAAATPTA